VSFLSISGPHIVQDALKNMVGFLPLKEDTLRATGDYLTHDVGCRRIRVSLSVS
jgi:hypothetical protein